MMKVIGDLRLLLDPFVDVLDLLPSVSGDPVPVSTPSSILEECSDLSEIVDKRDNLSRTDSKGMSAAESGVERRERLIGDGL
jgi:hypothetical protein